MFKHRWLLVLFVISCCTLAAVYAAMSAEAGQELPLRIDIPTKLEKANVVVDFGHAVYLATRSLLSATSICSPTMFASGTPKAGLSWSSTATRLISS